MYTKHGHGHRDMLTVAQATAMFKGITGLGLWLSREIVLAYFGEYNLVSRTALARIAVAHAGVVERRANTTSDVVAALADARYRLPTGECARGTALVTVHGDLVRVVTGLPTPLPHGRIVRIPCDPADIASLAREIVGE